MTMSTGALARRIRRSAYRKHRKRFFWRHLGFRFRQGLALLHQWGIVGGFALTLTLLLSFIGIDGNDGGASILTLNALGSAAGVVLLTDTKLILDKSDLPRMDALAVLPWADHQWFYFEYLRSSAIRLVLPLCFSVITLLRAQYILMPHWNSGWALAILASVSSRADSVR
jgi:hypothetical protein